MSTMYWLPNITSNIVLKSSKLLLPLSCLLNYASKDFCTTYRSFPLLCTLKSITKHYINSGNKYIYKHAEINLKEPTLDRTYKKKITLLSYINS